MRKLREVLRLKCNAQLTNRAIGRAVNISPSSVSYYVRALLKTGKSWDDIKDLSDPELEQLLTPHCIQLRKKLPTKAAIDFKTIHHELKHKGVTLLLLWQEYQQQYPHNCYSYSNYCHRYRRWRKKLSPSMRQTHIAGEKCFIDYAGPKVPIRNPKTGKTREAMIFVACLGASHYSFAEATWTRNSEDWLSSHQRMLAFFGGVPKLLIPDNEKSGITHASYYDPDLNRSYAHFATHYQTTVLPTRPRKPQDKSKVELSVQIVERWILARLRKRIFFSLEELNQAISVLLIELNNKPFQKLEGTRQSQFESVDKPALSPLPIIPYEYTSIKTKTVRLDYHIEVDGHYYSVPHELIHKKVEYRLTAKTIEIFYQAQRVASHLRSYERGKATCCQTHMPNTHREHDNWSPEKFKRWAQNFKPAVLELVTHVVQVQRHPECCYRIHLGLKRLYRTYGLSRFEKACHYALAISAPTFKSVQSILIHQLEDTCHTLSASNEENYSFKASTHVHIRGADYYKPS